MSEDGSGGWSVLEADISRTSHTHRGLSSGSTRHYRVSAINSAGTGPHSNTAHATTDSVDLPGAPQSLTARADGETEIDLSWSRPSNDGGSRVTGYRIEVSEDGSGGWSVLEADTSRTSHTHRGLSSGSTRHYRVSAINSAGTGPHSNTAHATTDSVDLPGAPQSLTARADGETEIELSWRSPSSDGGSRVTGYRIEVSEDGSGGWSVLEADTSRTSHTHRGLSSGSTRHYRVSAINSAGTGPHSNTAHATTDSVDLPGAPQSLTARADGETEIELSWRSPSSDGGSRVTGYRIEVSEDGSGGWSVLEDDTSRTSHTHRGLSSGSTRHYRVSAINSAGTGPHSNTAHATTDSVDLPGAPQSLTARADGETEIELSWRSPSSDGGSRVTGYRIEVSEDGSGGWSVLEDDTSRTSHTHRGLSSGSTRYYRVSAINSAGTGPPSNTAHATTATPAVCDGYKNDLLGAIQKGVPKIVQCVVDEGADVNATDSNGDPMLYWAMTGGNPEIVRILVDARADVNAKDSHGDPMLYWAMTGGNPKIVQILVDAHADVNAKDGNENPMLYWAMTGGNPEIVQILVDARADVNAKDGNENPMLYWAITGGNPELVQILVDARADVDAKDGHGDPMLYWAITGGNPELVRILVDANADVNARTADGTPLLTVAKNTGNQKIIKILEDAGATEE